MKTREEFASRLFALLDEGADAYIWNDLLAESDDPFDLNGIDLSGRDLHGYHFTGCNLKGANLSGCILRRASLEACTLVDANLASSDLTGASFKNADARNASFARACMEGTNLSWANLQNSELEEVDLAGTRLWKTDLRGARYPEFTRGKDHDYLTDDNHSETITIGATKKVPLTTMLRQVGAMVGTPYRWVDDKDEIPHVELPRADQNPQRYLDMLIIALNLRKVPHRRPDGSVDHFQVSR